MKVEYTSYSTNRFESVYIFIVWDPIVAWYYIVVFYNYLFKLKLIDISASTALYSTPITG
jgi:hypothetical protein